MPGALKFAMNIRFGGFLFVMITVVSAALFVLSVSLLGCADGKPPAQEPVRQQPPRQEEARRDGHNAANALDWWGTYEGVLPCADCEGIRTVLTLTRDMTYSLSATYVGRSETPFVTNGSFVWNEAGNTVILAGTQNRPNLYFVGEGYVLQLDMRGQKIQGQLAEKYRLKRQAQAVQPATVE